ncbi:MAG: hypothetical protein ACI8Y4_002967 [Candidatus Poriferisodalaceae bacterium]|jgi:hypothetical protein
MASELGSLTNGDGPSANGTMSAVGCCGPGECYRVGSGVDRKPSNAHGAAGQVRRLRGDSGAGRCLLRPSDYRWICGVCRLA